MVVMTIPSMTAEYLKNIMITPGILTMATHVSEYKGKQSLFDRQVPQVLETLRKGAMIQSAESSNRIEGIVISSQRLASIVRGSAEPETRSENDIAGYRDVLTTIHAHYEHIALSPNTILQLHRDLMKYSGTGGRWKTVDNVIEETLPSGEVRVRFVPTPAWRTHEAMDALCRSFLTARDMGTLPDYVLIGLFVLDFLCIHPFADGNGRMARLLTLLLLYQSGHSVGRYISLEKVIEDAKEQYYETLYMSSNGWHTDDHDSTPWLSYFLPVLLETYRRFEERVGKVENTQKKGWKQARIAQVVNSFVGDFTIADVTDMSPGISRPTITKTLNELGRQGVIVCIERGRHAKWTRKQE